MNLERSIRKMTQLVIFSKSIFEFSKTYSQKKIINAIIHDREIFVDFTDIYLLPLWSALETKNNSKELFNTAKKFIQWEHHHIIQPRLEMSLLKVGESFERLLKNIPGKSTEKTILRPFKIRTTIYLNCFKGKHLRTKNF